MSVARMSHSILRQCTLSQLGLVTSPPVSAEFAFQAHLCRCSKRVHATAKHGQAIERNMAAYATPPFKHHPVSLHN